MLLPFSAPIVGARFRPPAADVLNNLPGDQELVCVREPLNPHDENAIRVVVDINSIMNICQSMLEPDQEMSDVFAIDERDHFHLGYVPRDKAEMLAGYLDAMGGECKGKLSFNVEGRPQVEMSVDDGIPEEIA